jgi:predicted nucleotidyltransferase
MDDRAQLAAISTLVHRVLGDDARGGYLHGSTGAGTRMPTSDTDVLVVTDRPMALDQRRALVEGLLALSGRAAEAGPARPVELTVIVQRDVQPWRRSPVEDFLYGEWERATYQRGALPARRPNDDLAVLLTMALDADSPLFGPRPSALLDRPPTRDLIAACTAGIPSLLADLESDTRNVLLTLARILVTAETGQLVAKDQAADAVLPRLAPPIRPVLERARDAYRGPGWGTFDDLSAQLRPCADALVDAIGAAMGRAGALTDRTTPRGDRPRTRPCRPRRCWTARGCPPPAGPRRTSR